VLVVEEVLVQLVVNGTGNPSNIGGNGGNGTASSITGSSVT
jgi:hypothetical protein